MLWPSSGGVGQVEESRRVRGGITSPMPFTDELGYMWAVWSGFTTTATIRHGFAFASSSSVVRQAVMATWVVSIVPILQDSMSDEYTLDRVYCQDIVPGTAVDQDYVGTLNVPGLNGSGALPGQDAVVISWLSALRGRSNRGRTYWPGLACDQLQSGIVSSGALGPFVDYAVAMLAAFGPTAVVPPARLGTISKQEDGIPRGPVLLETVDFFVRSAMGVRRRRAQTFGGGP